MGEPRAAVAQAAPQVLNSKKRSLECNADVQNTKCFKIRAVIKDLRPCFLEVLQTPDFRDCKATYEIREKLKVLIELYEHMRADIGKCKHAQEGEAHGAYIIGGSAFGWNFITFPGKESVFYGVTKEQFRLGSASLEKP